MRYTVNRPRFEHDGEHIPEGGIVELSEVAAAPLLASGAIAPAAGHDSAAALDASVTQQVVEQAPQLAGEIAAGGGVDAAATIAADPASGKKSKK